MMSRYITILFILLQNTEAFLPIMSIEPFNQWHCIDFVKNIDKTKPYSYNIGDLPLVSWFDKNQVYTTMNICEHMGSKLDEGKVENGCLYCPYHGIEYNKSSTLGESLIYQDKLWWSYDPIKKSPPSIPFYNNKNYETSTITVDIDANIKDCIKNTMDINHPALIHNNLLGFGSNIPPQNIKKYKYKDQDKLGMSFNYKSFNGLTYLKKGLKKSINFHMYEYPLTSWSRVSLPYGENLYVNVNLLPLSNDKTKWIVTLKHNFWKSEMEKEFLKFTAKCIIYQDKLQMKRQSQESILKNLVCDRKTLPNENHMKDVKDMVDRYKYPSTGRVISLYNYALSKR